MPLVTYPDGSQYYLRTPVNESPCLKHYEAHQRQERAFREAFGAFFGDLAYPPNRSPQIGPPQRIVNLPRKW